MGVCYIVGAGDFGTPFSPRANDLVIAADGGLSYLKEYGIRCDLALGDFDSLGHMPEGIERIVFPVEKDYTDTALALYEGERRGFREFVILGGTGGREDHTFANFSLLLEAKERGLFARLVSKSGTVFVIKNEKVRVKCDTGRHLSVFSFGGIARGVSISGLKYEASGIDITPSCHLASCNLFVGRYAEIEVKDGALIVFVESASSEIGF